MNGRSDIVQSLQSILSALQRETVNDEVRRVFEGYAASQPEPSATPPTVAQEPQAATPPASQQAAEAESSNNFQPAVRNIGQIFNPTVQLQQRRRGRGRGRSRGSNRFNRIVVLIPCPRITDIPRGRLRQHLRDEGLESRVQFRTSMSAIDVRQAIMRAFQENGHLVDVTDSSQYDFLECQQNNGRSLTPMDDTRQHSLNGVRVQAHWRSQRIVYIRPHTQLNTYHPLPTRSRSSPNASGYQFRQRLSAIFSEGENEVEDEAEAEAEEDDDDDDEMEPGPVLMRDTAGTSAVTGERIPPQPLLVSTPSVIDLTGVNNTNSSVSVVDESNDSSGVVAIQVAEEVRPLPDSINIPAFTQVEPSVLSAWVNEVYGWQHPNVICAPFNLLHQQAACDGMPLLAYFSNCEPCDVHRDDFCRNVLSDSRFITEASHVYFWSIGECMDSRRVLERLNCGEAPPVLVSLFQDANGVEHINVLRNLSNIHAITTFVRNCVQQQQQDIELRARREEIARQDAEYRTSLQRDRNREQRRGPEAELRVDQQPEEDNRENEVSIDELRRRRIRFLEQQGL